MAPIHPVIPQVQHLPTYLPLWLEYVRVPGTPVVALLQRVLLELSLLKRSIRRRDANAFIAVCLIRFRLAIFEDAFTSPER
jgi:nitrate reductase assembly molybdenum cofactor insertion protein NarJ